MYLNLTLSAPLTHPKICYEYEKYEIWKIPMNKINKDMHISKFNTAVNNNLNKYIISLLNFTYINVYMPNNLQSFA